MKKHSISFIKIFFKWIFIPTVLFLFWVFVTLLTTSTSFLSISTFHNIKELTLVQKGELTKGKTVKGVFTATTPNLGIVSVRFNTYERINSDVLLFKIKEKGQQNWYYQNLYKVDQFQPESFFTFGFPVIAKSQGKTFEFELVSTKGEHMDAVAISSYEPVFSTTYKYYRSDFVGWKIIKLPLFALQKIFYSFQDVNITATSIVYLLPFIFYCLWLILHQNNFKWFIRAMILLTLVHIFFWFYIENGVIFFGMGLYWVFLAFYYRLSSKIFMYTSLFYFLLSMILLSFMFKAAEQSIIWSFIFFLIFSITNLQQDTDEKVRRITTREFVTTILFGKNDSYKVFKKKI